MTYGMIVPAYINPQAYSAEWGRLMKGVDKRPIIKLSQKTYPLWLSHFVQ